MKLSPLTEMESPSALTSASRLPRIESYLKQVGQGRGIRQVVDRNEVDVVVSKGGAHDIAADAPESIDANFHGHDEYLRVRSA